MKKTPKDCPIEWEGTYLKIMFWLFVLFRSLPALIMSCDFGFGSEARVAGWIIPVTPIATKNVILL
jgi:hypothetical protein